MCRRFLLCNDPKIVTEGGLQIYFRFVGNQDKLFLREDVITSEYKIREDLEGRTG